MKYRFYSFTAIVLMFSFLTAGCSNTAVSDYDLYIFNTKGESAAAMDAAAAAYTAETGKKVKVFSLGSGTNASDTLRAEMNSKNKPAIFSIVNITELAEWQEGGFALDLSTVTDENFKKLHDEIPENMRLTSDGKNSYGIPYNVEGYGYIVDTRMIDGLFSAEYADAFLEDIKNASYDEFEDFVDKLDKYIKGETGISVTLRGNTYPFAEEKTELTKKLNGVFAVAGSEKWTYGDHLINVALNTSFKTPADAKKATEKDIDSLKGAFLAYAETLDLKTSHSAGLSGPLPRGADFINSTTNNYDASVQVFAEGKALLLKQGNWVYTNIEKANPEITDTLTFIPIKMPVTQADITADNLTPAKLSRSIPVYVPNYYAVNAKASEAEIQEALNFLVWLNTSDSGKKFITEDMAFIPYNANPEEITLDNSLGNSIIEYINEGNIISNPYAGTPAGWSSEIFGLEIMEKYLTKPDWTRDDYEAIADYGISSWKNAINSSGQ